MPGFAVLGVVIPVILLPIPAVATQILGSVGFALLVVLGVSCVRQWRAARRWDRVLKAYADRDIARRREPAKHDQLAAHVRKPPPPRAGNSGGQNPR
jgi:hypothetical protein